MKEEEIISEGGHGGDGMEEGEDKEKEMMGEWEKKENSGIRKERGIQ